MIKKDLKVVFSAIYGGLDALRSGVQKLEEELKEESPRNFYPMVGTVFLDQQSPSPRPLIVEPQKDLAVKEPGSVAFYDREEGMGDWRNWLSDVRSGRIEVLWCAKHGSCGNSDYLKLWSLT